MLFVTLCNAMCNTMSVPGRCLVVITGCEIDPVMSGFVTAVCNTITDTDWFCLIVMGQEKVIRTAPFYPVNTWPRTNIAVIWNYITVI